MLVYYVPVRIFYFCEALSITYKIVNLQNVNGCVTINPERLAKGYVAGTFARLEIHPTEANSLCNDIACQVVRI